MKCRLVTKDTDNPNNAVAMEAVRFFLKALLGKKVYDHVKVIDVKLDASLQLKDDGEAFITPLKDGKMKVRIKVRKGINLFRVINTLAHECVHAKQYITGDLHYDDNGDWIWQGKNYGQDPYLGLTTFQVYRKLPWEREAVENEAALTKQFIEYYLKTTPL